uniref:Uncharacterized protein n=1 Tax=Brassica campestris TaxID=3711 RepID=A0A3P6BTR1_BRACM|nr:unnamed protein product [Brassica rapa]
MLCSTPMLSTEVVVRLSQQRGELSTPRSSLPSPDCWNRFTWWRSKHQRELLVESTAC